MVFVDSSFDFAFQRGVLVVVGKGIHGRFVDCELGFGLACIWQTCC
jgi:hypothetical protein